jgi:multisite-specific tRNA:(cytosine-C5)-methyltransferase
MSSSLDDNLKARMSEGHWPPKNVETLKLPHSYVLLPVRKPLHFLTIYTHSMRIYPHLQDSGGFFVAVLEKIRDPASHSEIIS